MTDFELDARGLLCPMPVIRTQNFINELAPGDALTVTCSDPGAKHDIPAWCRVHGHRVNEILEHGDEIIISITIGTNG